MGVWRIADCELVLNEEERTIWCSGGRLLPEFKREVNNFAVDWATEARFRQAKASGQNDGATTLESPTPRLGCQFRDGWRATIKITGPC